MWRGDFPATASFYPIARPRNVETMDRAKLWHEFENWYRVKPVGGLSVLPPRTPQPEALKRAAGSTLWLFGALTIDSAFVRSVVPVHSHARLVDVIPVDLFLAPFLSALVFLSYQLAVHLNRLRVLWLMRRIPSSLPIAPVDIVQEAPSRQSAEMTIHQTV